MYFWHLGCRWAATSASAGDYSGDTLVRVQGTLVAPDSSADVNVPGADARVSTEWIPTLTLTHFFTKNVAAELFCCFARFNAEGRGTLDGKDLGSFWAFPPILTLQYHFDPISGFKPYVGAGVQYIHYFDGGHSDLGGAKISLDDSWGFALQGGVDVEIGKGWYVNADIKKVWLDTDASWAGYRRQGRCHRRPTHRVRRHRLPLQLGRPPWPAGRTCSAQIAFALRPCDRLP